MAYRRFWRFSFGYGACVAALVLWAVVPDWDRLSEAVAVREIFLLLYCVAVGFVSAGIAASFYRLVTAEPARFALLGQSAFGLATSFVFCALTGPVIVVDFALRSRRAEQMPFGWRMAGVAIAALWSCCLGLVVLALVLTVRDSLV